MCFELAAGMSATLHIRPRTDRFSTKEEEETCRFSTS